MTTLHDFIFTPLGRFLVFYCLLLTILQVDLLLSTVYASRRLLPGVVFALFCPPVFIFTALLLGYIFQPLEFPQWTLSFFHTPLWPHLLFILLMSSAAVCNLRWLLAWKKSHMTAAAIKETIDLLPSGICVGDERGMIVMVNLRMDALYRQITGQQLMTLPLLWQSLTQAAQGSPDQNDVILPHPDGSVILFSRSPIQIQGKTYTQVTAVDITVQSHMTDELVASNAQLTSSQKRISEYGERVDELVRMQEILNAKVIVHDEVGHALLMIQYFMEHPQAVDQDSLLSLLKNTNDYLLREAEDASHVDCLAAALDMARDIGVRVAIQGTAPTNTESRLLLSRAVTECAANTLKHADGDRLDILLSSVPGRLTVSITNNGKPPRGEIQENGGLKSLRRLVTQAGGEMTVKSVPRFQLILSLPNEKEEEYS